MVAAENRKDENKSLRRKIDLLNSLEEMSKSIADYEKELKEIEEKEGKQDEAISKIREDLKVARTKGGSTIHSLFKRALERLNTSKNPDILRYLALLGNVLRFSRCYPVSKR